MTKKNTGIDNTGENNTGNRNSGDRNSGDGNSGDRNSGDGNSGNRNSGNWNSGYWNSGDWNSGNRNSGNWNSGDWNSGNWNSGNWNSGNWNSGYGNSGAFNTDEPNARLFNRETDVKMSMLRSSPAWPDMSGMSPCVWVDSSMMTDEEKKAHPSHETTRGYLKTLEYKQAWAVFWRQTSEANRQKFLALPNFDKDIFFEITGIRTDENSEAKHKAKELREQADALLAKAKELESSL